MRFNHDCQGCEFLGEWREYDLYFCKKCENGTVIARYGSEGSNYASCALDILVDRLSPDYTLGRLMSDGSTKSLTKAEIKEHNENDPLIAAYRLTLELGLI